MRHTVRIFHPVLQVGGRNAHLRLLSQFCRPLIALLLLSEMNSCGPACECVPTTVTRTQDKSVTSPTSGGALAQFRFLQESTTFRINDPNCEGEANCAPGDTSTVELSIANMTDDTQSFSYACTVKVGVAAYHFQDTVVDLLPNEVRDMGVASTSSLSISLAKITILIDGGSNRDKYDGGCLAFANGSFPGQLSKTTGDALLDNAMNEEANYLYGVFSVAPNLFVFYDGYSPNAFASPQVTLAGYFGTVYLGYSLIYTELCNMSQGPVALKGVMAHEWNHVLQFSKGTRLALLKDKELQSDFMAGYYLRVRGAVDSAAVYGFANALYSRGDYYFWNPQHHGTPEERVQAMFLGFEYAGVTDRTTDDAFDYSEKWLLGEIQVVAMLDRLHQAKARYEAAIAKR
jgi:hypothetical protein